MKKLIITTIILSTVSLALHAQFHHAMGTEKYESGRSVQSTLLERGFIVAGYTDYEVFGNLEATLIKTKPDGGIDWSAVYGHRDFDVFNSVREVPFTGSPNLRPGYAALGTTNSFGFGNGDMYFVRTDLAGNPLFSYTYGRDRSERGHCLQYIKDSNIGYGYVMAGETNSYPFLGGVDVYVVKTDEFGNLIRAVVIGGTGDDRGHWIAQTKDEGYIVVGATTSRTCGVRTPNYDIFVMRLNSNLTLMWNAIIGGGSASPFSDFAYSVAENPEDGSFIITGITNSFGVNNNGDAFLLNLKSDGSFNWMKTYGDKRTEQGTTLHVTRNPFSGKIEYVVGGYSNSFVDGSNDGYVFKTDDNGNLLWTAIYENKGRESVAELTDSGERGYVFTGDVDSHWTHGNDVYLVKTDFNGKSGDCERFVRQIEKRNDVCYTRSAQQVYVDESLRVQTLVKRIDYRVNRCSIQFEQGSIKEPTLLGDPMNNTLRVELDAADYANGVIRIFNGQGKFISQHNITGDQVEIPLTELNIDLYILHIIKGDGTTIYRKFVRQ